MAGDSDAGNTDRNSSTSAAPQRRGRPEEESNPFVAFRRFADEQVSSMLQSVIGLPSTVSPPYSGRWTIFTDDNGYDNKTSYQRSGGDHSRNRDYALDGGAGSSPSGDRDDASYNDTDKPTPRPKQSRWPEYDDPWHSQSWRKWCNGPSDFFGLDSFFDRFWLEDRFFPFSSHILHPHHGFFLPDMFEDSDSPTWPIAYTMFSPYSPLHLERQAHYRAHRDKGVFSSIMSSLRWDSDDDPAESRWREAFEDLLRLENGLPMLDSDASALTRTESGKDWLQGLVKRGSLGDRWKYVSGTDGQPWSGITFSNRAEDARLLPEKESAGPEEKERSDMGREDADNELDLYDRFLRDIETREREVFRGVSNSPLLRFLLEERRRQQDELDQYERSRPQIEDERGDEDTESWLDLVSGGNRRSVTETPKGSTSAVEMKATESVPEPARSHVVSTVTRTERVRLADGSVQTKSVNTKRFADGREESDESVEVSHAPARSEDAKSTEPSNKSKNGWFWKD